MYKIDDDGTFSIIRGDSADFTIHLYEVDDKGEVIGEYNPEPGDTILFTVKKNTKSNDILIQKTGPNIDLVPADTKDLDYGSYKYDVQLTFASGFVDTVVPPTVFKVLEEVTF